MMIEGTHNKDTIASLLRCVVSFIPWLHQRTPCSVIGSRAGWWKSAQNLVGSYSTPGQIVLRRVATGIRTFVSRIGVLVEGLDFVLG